VGEEGRDGIRIVRGAPSDEELAAILGVLLLRPAAPTTAGRAEPAGPTRWTASARPGYRLRDGRPARPGPSSWRASAQPR